MKRLLLAAVLAVGMHAVLVSTHFTWLEKPKLGVSDREPIALSLEARISTNTAAQPNAAPQMPPSGTAPSTLPNHSSFSVPQRRDTGPDETRPEPRKASRVADELPSAVNTKPNHSEAAPPPTTKAPHGDGGAVQPNKAAGSGPRKTAANAVKQSNRLSTAAPPVAAYRQAVPIYKQNPPPAYPRIARLRGYEGTVMLNVLVGSDGKVRKCQISESSGYGVLDRAALKSVQKWLFEPGMQGPSKVDMWVTIPIRFQLD